jgi:hypothetical protein
MIFHSIAKNTIEHTIKLLLVITLFLASSAFVHAASLSISPSTGVYTAGQVFSARVIVNTNGASVNAADGTLKFNPSEITVLSVSKGPIFNLWTSEPTFSNAAGSITFSGGSPTGYTGSSGTVISITFKAAAAGNPKVSFSGGSVLAADGRGTNVLTTMNSAAFTIGAKAVATEPEKIIEYVPPANTPAAPQVTSATHPDSTKWYNVKSADLAWKVDSGIVAVRTLLDKNATAIPTKVYDTALSKITLADLDEGVQYFHVQLKNADGWGKVTHYRLAVDTQKPTAFDITLAPGSDISNPIQTLSLKAVDTASKVKRFSIQVDGKEAYEYIDTQGSSTVKLPSLTPGRHTVIIEAFDEANNSIISTFGFDVSAFDKPQFTEYPQEINEQVIPVIKGTTRPNSKVQVSLAPIGLGATAYAQAKTTEVQSNAQGEFTYIPDGRLSLGVYELTAVAIDQYGAQSAPSDAIRIAVQQPGYLQIGSMLVSALSVLIPLIALSVLLILGVWFLIFRIRRFRKGVTKEAKEALSMLTSEFAQLRKEITTQKTLMESSRKTNKLTKAEAELFEVLTQALRTSEKRVEKEITDVEDLVE